MNGVDAWPKSATKQGGQDGDCGQIDDDDDDAKGRGRGYTRWVLDSPKHGHDLHMQRQCRAGASAGHRGGRIGQGAAGCAKCQSDGESGHSLPSSDTAARESLSEDVPHVMSGGMMPRP